MTYYLKYRPQKIEELDLDGVRDSLSKIIKSERFPHAFLFSGPRGAGKTSTARILAKVLNCEKREAAKDLEPCNECPTCLSITKGSSLDVIEIDAASNRGVDDMRQLRDTVKLAPAGSKKKVYIIDEAHMLTTEAANALLKTLEEPPSHAVFVLATTESHKLLETIRSRCTAINFYKGTTPEIVRSLQKIVDGEKLDIEKEALEEISKRVDGSFREAHKILEQLSFSGEKITPDAVKKVMSGVSTSPQKFLELVKAKKTKEALEEIDTLVSQGVNLKSFITEAVGMLREEMLSAGTNKVSLRLIELLSESYRQLPNAVIPQLVLELVVWKWGEERGGLVSTLLLSNSDSNKVVTESRSVRTAQGSDSHSLNSSSDKDKLHSLTHNPPLKGEGGVKKEAISLDEIKIDGEVKEVAASAPIAASVVSEVELEALWREVMKLIRLKNTSLEALMRSCRPASFDGKTLTVEAFYKFHKEKLEQTAYRDLIEQMACQVLGINALRVFCVLSNTPKRQADVANVAPAGGDEISQLAEQIFSAPTDGKVH